MIKQIPVEKLVPGMYVHDLNVAWTDHPFLRNRFAVESEADIRKIRDAGASMVFIDTERGADVTDAPTVQEVRAAAEREMLRAATSEPPAPVRVSLTEELARARRVHSQAERAVRAVMADIRLGRAVEMDQVEDVVTDITESVLRNAGALLGLTAIKNKDDYTFLHSVSVCTLMVTFARAMGLDAEAVHQAGIAGLLHDVGKANVPDEVLNKPGRLTDAEFDLIKRHPADGHAMLLKTPGVGPIPLDVARHHHERVDGSGYPDKLKDAEITEMAKMAAVVDVYDAITADRCYHKGIPATEALRKLFEWSKFHFDPHYVQHFMRCVGIYPVGTLVRLESGRLGVVTEQNEGSLITPKVRAFFSVKSNTHIKPVEVDLSRPLGAGGADRILHHEDPVKWGMEAAALL